MEGDQLDKVTALITGAARGIGREYALQLAERHYDLILVDKSEMLRSLAEEISARYGIQTRVIICDLACESAAQILFDDVKAHGEKVDVLINNAGEFSFCDICETSEETIRRIITLHDLTLTYMNRLFAADMASRGGGYILNMSSFSIWMPLPGLTLYSASKAYNRSFSIAFSKEVREKGVYVTAICPAGVATDLYGLSPRFQKLALRLGVLVTPKFCARRALKAMFAHRRCVIPDWWNRLFIPVLTHLPNWLENIIRRKTKQYQK